MKVTSNMINEVIEELIGSDAINLVDFLKNNKDVSEFQISTKIKIPVDRIRNQLYRLYNHNLVTFIRKKDKEKGWYIYYWSLNQERVRFLTTDIKIKKVEKLNDRLLREENSHFFSCINTCIRIDFEQATNFNYMCPECGELLGQENNSDKISKIKKEIEFLNIQIKDDQEKKQKAIDKLATQIEKDENKIKDEKNKKKSKKATPTKKTKKK